MIRGKERDIYHKRYRETERERERVCWNEKSIHLYTMVESKVQRERNIDKQRDSDK